MTDADLTLPQIEAKLRRLVNDLAGGQLALADCRNTEVYAKFEYEQKRRRLLMSPNAPRVGRGEGEVTAAARDAWVEVQCEEEQQTYDLAVVRREAASEHLRVLRDQAMIVMALAKTVQVNMGLVGATQT